MASARSFPTARLARHGLCLAALLGAVSGCAPGPGTPPRPAPPPLAAPERTAPRPATPADSAPPASPPPPTPRYPRVTPVTVPVGRVVSAVPGLRFAVVDYSLSPLPPVGLKLGVYRQGARVGEVQITGPARDGKIAADLLAGDAQTGDEVRAD